MHTYAPRSQALQISWAANLAVWKPIAALSSYVGAHLQPPFFVCHSGCEQELKKRVCTEDTRAPGGRDDSRCHNAQGQPCSEAKIPNSCIARSDCKESPAVCTPKSTGEQEVFRADQPERYRPTIFGNVGA